MNKKATNIVRLGSFILLVLAFAVYAWLQRSETIEPENNPSLVISQETNQQALLLTYNDTQAYPCNILPYDEELAQKGTLSNGAIVMPLIQPDENTPYTVVNDNEPFFTKEEKTNKKAFETYSELDAFERCGPAYANICTELMPTEKRGDIGSVKPTGWRSVTYPDLIPDRYLYNRCHLIGYQLAGENANKHNLITGTRFLNVVGMLPFEDQVDDYIEEHPNNHVLYRVSPMFIEDDLVARGVLMEAYSVEDNGNLAFCVFCYNTQPGITINYNTGDSRAS